MVNNLIEQVVDIQIRNITSNTYTRDLNTILVAAAHTQFTAPELYREYVDTASVLADGFTTSSYVYRTLSTAFAQDVKPTKVIVAQGVSADDYLGCVERMLVIPTGWLWLVSDLRDQTKQVEIAQFLETNQKFYMAATHDADAFDNTKTTDLGSELKELGLKNTAVWYDTEFATGVPNHSEMAVLGRCANGVAGTVNFRLKQLRNITLPDTIDTLTKISTLVNKNYNFAASLEGQVRSYGSGKVVGGEWIHIRLGITWLEVGIREDVFYTIADTEKLGMENDGAAAIEASIRSRLSRGQKIGIIAKDSPINVLVPNVLDLTPQQRATGILPNVSFDARMSGAIQGTVIRGSVYL